MTYMQSIEHADEARHAIYDFVAEACGTEWTLEWDKFSKLSDLVANYTSAVIDMCYSRD